jgi:hypothetical protein
LSHRDHLWPKRFILINLVPVPPALESRRFSQSKQIHREFLADLKRVDGKMQILSRVAEAVVEQPDGIVREVIFSQVKEETLRVITGACCLPY